MRYTLVNNFEKMKKAFTKETGEDPEKEKELYLQYFQVKALDNTAQLLSFTLKEMDQLKGEMRGINQKLDKALQDRSHE